MIGTHMATTLRARGYETFGIARSSASSRMEGIAPEGVYRVDVLDRDHLQATVEAVRPDLVVHLAAQAYNGRSWDTETLTHQTNILGTLNVLKSVRAVVPEARVVLACSSAEYGDFDPADVPLKEDHPLRPITPYGISKVATENLGFQYYANFGLNVYLPRLFIHVGTGHPPATAIQNFARQLAMIARGKMEPVLRVGNLETGRDFVDVRDGVAAINLLVERGQPGTPVNICTQTGHTIRNVLETLIEIAGLDVEVEQDPALFRPSDEPMLVGSNERIRALGWKPEYTLRETLEAVYRDWLDRIDR